MKYKDIFTAGCGAIGSFFVYLFGPWNGAIMTLVIFMAVDYVTGLILAGVSKKSKKSKSGALESRAGWKGIVRKGITLLIVLVAGQLDKTINTDYIRNAVIIAFIANEAISILENSAMMGVPIPKVLIKAIDVLKEKSNDNSNDESNENEIDITDDESE